MKNVEKYKKTRREKYAKPCIICGTLMIKADSVKPGLLICSDECKKINHANAVLNMRTNRTPLYWIERGFSEEEAIKQISEIQKRNSPRNVEHWINKGFTKEEATAKVSEWQSELGKQNLIKYTPEERSIRSSFNYQSWINKGFTEEQAKEKIKSIDYKLRLLYKYRIIFT